MDAKKILSSFKKNEKKSKNTLREILTLLFLFFAFAFLLSLLSYNSGDPSFFNRNLRTPTNLMGRFGANVAEASIQTLGFSSYLLAFFVCMTAFQMIHLKEKKSFYTKIAWVAFCIIHSSSFLHFLLGTVEWGPASLLSGGMVGQWFHQLFLYFFNFWGSFLYYVLALTIAATFVTPIPFKGFFAFVRRCSQWINEWRKKIFSFFGNVIESQVEPAVQKLKAERMIEANINAIANQTKKIEPSSKMKLEVHDRMPLPPKKTSTIQRTQGDFHLPSLDALNNPTPSLQQCDRGKLVENSRLLEAKLNDFGIEGNVVAVRPGPVITMYEFKPGPGVKISQIAALADDLSLALSAQSVRIVAPIPGKSVVGIEIPNAERERVLLKEILSTTEFTENQQGIPLAIGKDISGEPVVSDLSKMPHLLIAGAPGAGKSVFINSLICSLLYKFTPNKLRLIMVDPKQLELNLYEDIPHLLLPIVDDPKKASNALKWAVNEMERRYKIMAKSGIRNLVGFNEKLERDGQEKMKDLLCPKSEDGMPDPSSLAHLFDHDEKGQPKIEPMPVILVIIDEFADLMMVAPKDIETSVARLAQKARAAGIHLVIATQRPSVDVITGLIKANLPSRISFQVASKIDSRTILDSMGAEKLLGQGDMLFIPPGLAKLTRIHGAYVNEEEIEKICEHWRAQGKPIFREEILLDAEEGGEEDSEGADDELYPQALQIVREMGQASASMLQRRLKIGYNRAARLVETLEAQGIIGPADGSRPREVLM